MKVVCIKRPTAPFSPLQVHAITAARPTASVSVL
jgi:hypothetical protein